MNEGWENQTDLQVVQGFLKGLPGAREALGDRLACVHAYIEARNSKLGRPLEPGALADLRQDCLTSVLQALKSYTGEGPIAAWSQGFVRFTFLKFFRERRGESTFMREMRNDFSEPETQAPDHLDHTSMEDVLAELEPIERRTLSMRFLEELQFQDIAKILDEPITTTKSRFARLVVRLGPLLQTFWKSEYNEGNE